MHFTYHNGFTDELCENGEKMRPQLRIAFAYFWPGFTVDHFRAFFPFVYDKYDLVPSQNPEVVFYSVFAPQFRPYADPRHHAPVARIPAGNYLRVFLTGENFEPDMEGCEFAMTFSALVDHPNHLRLPLWVYEGRGWGYGPERLVKASATDWEKVAREKTQFCNFVYLHEVPYRDAIFRRLSAYKPVDAAGRCLNNMNGWTVPMVPNRTAGNVEFTRFATMKEMLAFVREIDNDRDLYLKMLAAPFYRGNVLPDYARDDKILAFFDRIAAAALA